MRHLFIYSKLLYNHRTTLSTVTSITQKALLRQPAFSTDFRTTSKTVKESCWIQSKHIKVTETLKSAFPSSAAHKHLTKPKYLRQTHICTQRITNTIGHALGVIGYDLKIFVKESDKICFLVYVFHTILLKNKICGKIFAVCWSSTKPGSWPWFTLTLGIWSVSIRKILSPPHCLLLPVFMHLNSRSDCWLQTQWAAWVSSGRSAGRKGIQVEDEKGHPGWAHVHTVHTASPSSRRSQSGKNLLLTRLSLGHTGTPHAGLSHFCITSSPFLRTSLCYSNFLPVPWQRMPSLDTGGWSCPSDFSFLWSSCSSIPTPSLFTQDFPIPDPPSINNPLSLPPQTLESSVHCSIP